MPFADYCNDGCLTLDNNPIVIVSVAIFVAILSCYLLSYYLCPWLCPMCPRPVRGVTFDQYTGMAVPLDRNAMSLDTHEERRPDLGDSLPHYTVMNDDPRLVRRRQMAGLAAAGPYQQ